MSENNKLAYVALAAVFATFLIFSLDSIVPKSKHIAKGGITQYKITDNQYVYEWTPRRVPEVTCILAKTLVCVPKSKIWKPPVDNFWMHR